MKCSICSKKAVFGVPYMCQDHFVEHFEEKFYSTINLFKLIDPGDKIICATSGGKDSSAMLHLIAKKYKNVTALAIDEGIKGYRERTLIDLKKFCKERSIDLNIISFENEFGTTLDCIGDRFGSHCLHCGVLRRYLLNKYSQGYDCIVTGHNMDDELQSVLMNMLQNNLELCARLGPRTGVIVEKRLTKRVKPLYMHTEKEVMTYCVIKGFELDFIECPHANTSSRFAVRDELNDIELKHPGSKNRLMEWFLRALPLLKDHFQTNETVSSCQSCGAPASAKLCRACIIVKKLKTL